MSSEYLLVRMNAAAVGRLLQTSASAANGAVRTLSFR